MLRKVIQVPKEPICCVYKKCKNLFVCSVKLNGICFGNWEINEITIKTTTKLVKDSTVKCQRPS